MSAFIHAQEKEIKCFMEPPSEWLEKHAEGKDLVWQLVQSLYGKRTAGASYRDFWEALVCSIPGHEYTQGEIESCLYHSEAAQVNILHLSLIHISEPTRPY